MRQHWDFKGVDGEPRSGGIEVSASSSDVAAARLEFSVPSLPQR